VDDQDLVLDFSQKFLRSAGYEVVTANSGETALRWLETAPEPVDLVLTDYSMPGMNGRQLIDRVAERWPGVKFILATGFIEDDERDQILASHGTRILNKPFNLAEAARLVSSLIRKDPAPSASA
jgi:CheY-like chemotaxis protein